MSAKETKPMDDLSEILISRETIASRVHALGEQITLDFEGKDLVCICILKGAAIFFSDLIRCIDLPLRIDFMSISSYGDATQTSGVVRILKDLDKDIVNADVLIIEDIIDTGLTLSFLEKNLSARGAKSLSICTLLDKPEKRKANIMPDYVGFVIEDFFAVGYGLDYAEKYRNLKDIGVLSPKVYSA